MPGLYFAGEILDIDALTGGFNFQSSSTVTLKPGENFVIDFRAAEGGFLFGLPGRADTTEDPR